MDVQKKGNELLPVPEFIPDVVVQSQNMREFLALAKNSAIVDFIVNNIWFSVCPKGIDMTLRTAETTLVPEPWYLSVVNQEWRAQIVLANRSFLTVGWCIVSYVRQPELCDAIVPRVLAPEDHELGWQTTVGGVRRYMFRPVGSYRSALMRRAPEIAAARGVDLHVIEDELLAWKPLTSRTPALPFMATHAVHTLAKNSGLHIISPGAGMKINKFRPRSDANYMAFSRWQTNSNVPRSAEREGTSSSSTTGNKAAPVGGSAQDDEDYAPDIGSGHHDGDDGKCAPRATADPVSGNADDTLPPDAESARLPAVPLNKCSAETDRAKKRVREDDSSDDDGDDSALCELAAEAWPMHWKDKYDIFIMDEPQCVNGAVGLIKSCMRSAFPHIIAVDELLNDYRLLINDYVNTPIYVEMNTRQTNAQKSETATVFGFARGSSDAEASAKANERQVARMRLETQNADELARLLNEKPSEEQLHQQRMRAHSSFQGQIAAGASALQMATFLTDENHEGVFEAAYNAAKMRAEIATFTSMDPASGQIMRQVCAGDWSRMRMRLPENMSVTRPPQINTPTNLEKIIQIHIALICTAGGIPPDLIIGAKNARIASEKGSEQMRTSTTNRYRDMSTAILERIYWRTEGSEHFAIEWNEVGAPPIPRRRGHQPWKGGSGGSGSDGDDKGQRKRFRRGISTKQIDEIVSRMSDLEIEFSYSPAEVSYDTMKQLFADGIVSHDAVVGSAARTYGLTTADIAKPQDLMTLPAMGDSVFASASTTNLGMQSNIQRNAAAHTTTEQSIGGAAERHHSDAKQPMMQPQQQQTQHAQQQPASSMVILSPTAPMLMKLVKYAAIQMPSYPSVPDQPHKEPKEEKPEVKTETKKEPTD